MNAQQLIKKVNEVAENQRQRRGYIAPVDVLMEIGVLTKQNYEAWRFGKVSYLEKACTCNLNKLTKILKQIYKYAQKMLWNPPLVNIGYEGKKGKNSDLVKVVDLKLSESMRHILWIVNR